MAKKKPQAESQPRSTGSPKAAAGKKKPAKPPKKAKVAQSRAAAGDGEYLNDLARADLHKLSKSLTNDLHSEAKSNAQALLHSLQIDSLERDAAFKEDIVGQLVYLQCCSDFFRDSITLEPQLLQDLIHSDLQRDRATEHYHTTAQELLHSVNSESSGKSGKSSATRDLPDEDSFMLSLRNWRRFEMLRILWRDLVRFSDTPTTLKCLSALADAAVIVAEEFSFLNLQKRFGTPVSEDDEEQRVIVLGMGKLGGRELNFSSDIDLILVFPEAGETRLPDKKIVASSALNVKQISNEEFFHKQAQAIVKLLGKVTEDGFVFRVDLRLRPFGSSGPLALNFSGLENYYLLQGREWERYAMIKARPLTGSHPKQAELLKLLRPFVYRRYLDYSVFESLRELKLAIASELEKKGEALNIKTGLGGIREIEFIGQAFQLLRGGREPELQQREILKVLEQLQESKLMDEQDVRQLTVSYEFLRRLENRLQMLRDEQEHCLPDKPEIRNRIALGMGLQSFELLQTELDSHRQAVNRLFSELFSFENNNEEQESGQQLAASGMNARPASLHAAELQIWLKENGFKQSEELMVKIDELRQSGFYASLTEVARQRAEKLLPRLMVAAANLSLPENSHIKNNNEWARVAATSTASMHTAGEQDATLLRLLELTRAIAGRSGYLQILIERPAALELLAGLFSCSSWLAEFVTRHPIVIDELLDERSLREVPIAAELKDQAVSSLMRLQHEDLGMQMDALRQFKQANTMRVAVGGLYGLHDIRSVGQQLTLIAESALSAASQVVQAHMQVQHGKPGFTDGKRRQSAEFAIAAYGKLGSAEMGLGSDLDIVFLHDSRGDEQQTSGERPLENARYFGRTAQKIVHFISTLTPAGVLYKIDARLRPNGRAGMLVSNLQSFESYQSEQAWVWEHQALVRARVVVGSSSFNRQFDLIRSRILGIKRDRATTATEVAGMRGRMAQELNDVDDHQFDVKHGCGGLVDIEFMVQYLVLTAAFEHPQMLDKRDNIGLLRQAADCNLLEQRVADQLVESCQQWHSRIHQMSLQESRALIPVDKEVEKYRGWVKTAWSDLLPEY